MTTTTSLKRRTVLAGAAAIGGSFTFGFSVPQFGARAAETAPELTAWVVIHPDEKVVIRIARSEMGQARSPAWRSSSPRARVRLVEKVTTEFPTPTQNLLRQRVWKNFSTGGSRGIRDSHQYVREGGAAARDMLVRAAAAEWKVKPEECSVERGVITHKASKRKLSYGKVAVAAAKLEPPKSVKLKDPKDWKIAGKPLKRLDTMDKLTGKQVYGIDLRLPGMLTATIKDAPVFGAKVVSYDADKVKSMPGVKGVVKVGDTAVAVIAETYWTARNALAALPVVWEDTPNSKVSSATIAAMLKEGLDAPEAFVGNKAGDAKAAISGAAKKVEAVYSYPYQHHATMEPMNATALYTADKCEVWCPTQNGEAALAATSAASGLPATKCEVYKLLLGGGFGRRGRTDYVHQVVQIAKQMPGVPIKLIWSREEDMTHCQYHPITMCKMVGGLDDKGNLVGLHVRISGQSILSSVLPQNLVNGMDPAQFQGFAASGVEAAYGYSVPNLLIDHAMRNPHVPPGFWRGVNTNQNAVYMESFMDELAHAAGQDPLEFRRKMLKPKWLAVLNAAAARAGYGKPLPRAISTAWRRSWATAATSPAWPGIGERCRRAEDPQDHGGDRQRPRRQPGAGRAPGRRLVRLRPVGGALRRDHRQGRRRRADQLRQLQRDAHRRDAEGRDGAGAVGRLLGRGRRADHRRGRAGGAQRHLQRHRQAHPLAAADEPRPEEGVGVPGAVHRAIPARSVGQRGAGRLARRTGRCDVLLRLPRERQGRRDCRAAAGRPTGRGTRHGDARPQERRARAE